MNVVILTPDRVGSTLLQRLITVRMAAHDYGQPVINLHELTNGIEQYYSEPFGQTVLGKPCDGRPWGYHQTLPEVVDLLTGAEHLITSRLAHYHLLNRADPVQDQEQLYRYINDNFYIIAAQREDLLEHALSWCIYQSSKKLNVYSHAEKIETFSALGQGRITIDPVQLVTYLNRYVEYTAWCDQHFRVDRRFNYEQDLPRVDEWISELPIWPGQDAGSWEAVYGQSFADWNLCHYLISDLSGLGAQLPPPEQARLPAPEGLSKPSYQLVQAATVAACAGSLSVEDQQFLSRNGPAYVAAHHSIQDLVDQRVLVTPVPIKLQTMMEKSLMIQDFPLVVKIYNDWAARTGLGRLRDISAIELQAACELEQWHHRPRLT
jgi:hypothetical protein